VQLGRRLPLILPGACFLIEQDFPQKVYFAGFIERMGVFLSSCLKLPLHCPYLSLLSCRLPDFYGKILGKVLLIEALTPVKSKVY
jgi:hypothetical protein